MNDNTASTQIKKTVLHDLHKNLNAKLVPFAGYEMPVQYASGIISEHLHVREKSGLFDVSHMGQALLTGPTHTATAKALEKLVPGAIENLKPGRMRYTLLMNDDGGIIDDLMVTRLSQSEEEGRFMLVVNAARKDIDYVYINEHLPDQVTLTPLPDKALIALQGPQSSKVLKPYFHDIDDLLFMSAGPAEIAGISCHISRAGYTGEDGFELSVSNQDAEALVRKLLEHDDVMMIGLGARDSLRLEAGLCLYGHDIDETTSPIEADLGWAVAKRRRETADFKGSSRVVEELNTGPKRIRVGLKLNGRAPAREGAEIVDLDDNNVGILTSGGYAPSLKQPIAMGYITPDLAIIGQKVNIMVRNKKLEAEIVAMPLIPQKYYRKKI